MKLFNSLTSKLFDLVLAPFGHALAAFDLLIWPVVAGVVALLVYKHVSNQKGIARAKQGIQVHLLEVVLYRDDLGGVLVSTAKALGQNALYLGFNIVPMIVMFLPMTVVLVQLVANYGYSPLPAGSRPLLEVQLAHDAPVKSTEVKLDLPPGLSLDAPPVRTPEGKIVYRLKADTVGDYVVHVTAGGETQDKGVVVGGDPLKVPVLRTNSLEAFLYPGEDALPSDSVFTRIGLKYPDRPLPVLPDGESGILTWFFLFSLGAGFALKDRFGVTL
jgi:hypothetical protein